MLSSFFKKYKSFGVCLFILIIFCDKYSYKSSGTASALKDPKGTTDLLTSK